MVDFQKRDTTRGLSDGRRRNGADADDEKDAEEDDGEAELDEVRQQLEERPDDAEDDQQGPGTDADATGEPDDGEEPADEATDEATAEARPDDDHGGNTHHDADVETLGAAVVTISSSRTMDDDPSGDYLVSSLVDAGHDVVTRELIGDDYDDIQHTVDTLVRRSDVDVVVTTGGTGVTPDDETIEAVRPLFDKELPGFGELFRSLSYDDVGTRIVATRATGGVVDGVPVFCLPGSTDAVELGVEQIIVDVAPHIAGLASPDREHDHDHEQPAE